MEMKNAAAVCLIALFSATLVALIARSLDNQAASRLEPQLTKIAEELHALRTQGGIAASPATSSPSEIANDGLIVYYFHSNARCPTCRAIESQAQETVQTRFASQLEQGTLVWKILNYETPSVKPLASKFEIQSPVVVLAKMKGGEIEDWKRLDEVWALVGDKPAFAKYVQEEIEQMLAKQTPPTTTTQTSNASIPIPESPKTSTPETSAKETPNIPIP
jgi:hypothetical protein